MNRHIACPIVLSLALGILSVKVATAADDSNESARPGLRRPGSAGPMQTNRPGDRDPSRMAPMLMREFDKNEDQKLDAEELIALITMIRERQAQMGGQPGMGPMMANRMNGGGFPGRRDVNNDGTNEAGGIRPKRPPVDDTK